MHNKTDFHRKGGALSLFLRVRVFETRKRSIIFWSRSFLQDILFLAPIDYPLGLRDRPKARSLVTNECHKLRVSSKNLASYIRKTDWFDFYVRSASILEEKPVFRSLREALFFVSVVFLNDHVL